MPVLWFRAFTGKSARPLVPNKHNQKVRYNSITVSYMQWTEWYLPKDMKQLESMFNKAKQSIKRTFLFNGNQQWTSLKKTVFSLWPCLHGGTIWLRNGRIGESMSSENGSSRPTLFLFFVHVRDINRDRFCQWAMCFLRDWDFNFARKSNYTNYFLLWIALKLVFLFQSIFRYAASNLKKWPERHFETEYKHRFSE